MDGGSSSLPLPQPPPPQVYLRRSVPPRHGPPVQAAPRVQLFRAPAPIPIFSSKPLAAVRVPIPPPAAVASAPAPASATALTSTDQPPQQQAGTMPPPPAPEPAAKRGPKTKAQSNEQNSGEYSQSVNNMVETAQGHDKETTPGPVKATKRIKKLKASKHNLGTSNSGAIEGDADPSLSSLNHCRHDSSLSLLTKKFINLLQGAEDGTLDLNKAAETLEVQKRRMYDITNVLEGVHLIEKGLKNMIRWKGFDMSKPKDIECQISSLKEELESLYDEEFRLDDEIREAKDKIQALTLDEDKRKLLYLLKEDINKIPHFQGSTVIAINAPHGTCVEVPDPNADQYMYGNLGLQEKHYKIVLRSSMGPIDCYLISDRQEIFNPDQLVAADRLEPAVATDSSQALQQMDCDPNQAPEKEWSNGGCMHTTEPSRKQENGIMRIVPSDSDADADYWLASVVDASMTDAWGT
ncbi:transcription factor E2FB-like [Miscanthus floridulus]|uniref:transcription factor E2FB-like n=1 Tax=Miscanthus floridulus TaxID=154761 RepID=UPI003459B894